MSQWKWQTNGNINDDENETMKWYGNGVMKVMVIMKVVMIMKMKWWW